jgi:flagellar capping protein FliD
MDALSTNNWLIGDLLYGGLLGNPLWPSLNTLPAYSNAVNSTSYLSQQYATDQSEISGYGQLLAAVSNFQSAVQPLTVPQAISPAQATSSNASVATATAGASAPSGTYTLSVSNLSQGQTTVSQAYTDPNTTIVGSGTLTIQLGTYNGTTNTFTAGSAPAVTVSVTNGSLNDIASAINGAAAGVTASVVQDGSGYHLLLSSANTGAVNAFSVSVADADGTNTDLSGLSQLAYDPTASAGAGKNLALTQAAQDATFSINGASATSASNTGISVAPDTTIALLQSGTTTVTVSPNLAAVQTSAQNLASAVNTLQSSLASLGGTTGSLASDPLVSQFRQALIGVFTQTFNNAGSFSSLTQIGINLQADGTVTMDQQALQSALNQDPASTTSLIQQAAQALSTIADTYGGPGGPMTIASQSLQESQQQILSLAGGVPIQVQPYSPGALPTGLSPQTLQWQVDQLLIGEMAPNVQSPSILSLYG